MLFNNHCYKKEKTSYWLEENICKHLSDKGLISKIYCTANLQLNKNNTYSPINNGQKFWTYTSTKNMYGCK